MRTSIRSHSKLHRASLAITATSMALATFMGHAPAAYADETEVSPDGKGIVGGALLGAEVVTIVEAIAQVRSGWAYVIGAIVGAGGGGVGGYFVEQANSSSDGKAPTLMLAGGIGLIIPALVLSLDATRYRPTEGASEDRAPKNAPVANPGTPGGSSVSSGGSSPPPPPPPASGGGTTHPPLSLFDMTEGAPRLGVPLPEVRPTFSSGELRQYGMVQQTEVRMPLVKITF
jgi:hypothetical protein